MSASRRTTLQRLAAMSDADTGEATTVEALAAELGVEESTVREHVEGLVACELARRQGDGLRVTVTGEQFLDLDISELGIVDPAPD